jgi:hypothetical protein
VFTSVDNHIKVKATHQPKNKETHEQNTCPCCEKIIAVAFLMHTGQYDPFSQTHFLKALLQANLLLAFLKTQLCPPRLLSHSKSLLAGGLAEQPQAWKRRPPQVAFALR